MARYSGPVCRLCRREGMKLFLKGERCYTEKCGYERRAVSAGSARPGAHQAVASTACGCARSRRCGASTASLERQFRGYYFEATAPQGRHGREDARLLERRLDNVVYRLGFASIAPRRASSCATATSWSTASASTSRAYLVRAGRQGRGPREEPQKIARIAEALARRRPPRRAAVARARQGELRAARSRALPVARRAERAASASSYVVEYYSQVIASYDSRARGQAGGRAAESGFEAAIGTVA